MNNIAEIKRILTRTETSRREPRQQLRHTLLMHLMMLPGVILVIFPLVFAIILSTQSSKEYYQVGNLMPGTAFIENYSLALSRADLVQLSVNTLRVTLIVALGKIVLSVLGAFALIYFRMRGKFLIMGVIVLTHFLPLPVRIVPTFELLANFKWVNTYNGLTIPFFASATGLLLFFQYFRTLSTDLIDAARVDGAGPLRFLLHIIVPISRTHIGALFLIEFIFMWNQYLWPIIVAKSVDTRQVQIGIKQLIATDSVIEWGVLMAGTVLVMIPPLIVLLFLQRSLMSGLTVANDDVAQ
jgi:sn-glycerol 3-phosphate transport system permease protein